MQIHFKRIASATSYDYLQMDLSVTVQQVTMTFWANAQPLTVTHIIYMIIYCILQL